MTHVAIFTFNAFKENTYVVYDDTKKCVIIDPGCYNEHEQQELVDFITNADLQPQYLLNTHCHIDHVFGNTFIKKRYSIPFIIHKGELPVLKSVPDYAPMYGFQMEDPVLPDSFVEEGDIIEFGETKLKVLFTPGHSPASICFYSIDYHFIISGDVIFEGSVGRVDLPGGNGTTLMESIKNKILPLDGNITLYPGHGNSTTIQQEKSSNPFILAYQRGKMLF